MAISATSSVHWRWNETDVSQFGNQINLGPVTGTVTLTYKAATGTFMVSPTIRISLSDGFNTPSGSLALIPINIDELPKNFNVRFFVNHFSTSNNIASDSTRHQNLCWGLLANCSSGTTRNDFNGTFYAIPFIENVTLMPKPVNSGCLNRGYVGSGAYLGMATSSYSLHEWSLKHLSMTGSYLSGTDIEAVFNYVRFVAAGGTQKISYVNYAVSNYGNIHWSGSAFQTQILNKIFLAFSYNPESVNYSPMTGTYVEIDSLQILKHPAGNGQEVQPPPEVYGFSSGTSDPSMLNPYLTYWTRPSGTIQTVSGNKITRLNKFSGVTPTFGNTAAQSAFTSSTSINGTVFNSALFSGSVSNSYMTSSVGNEVFVSGTTFRVYGVVNILTASFNNVSSYQNHLLVGYTAGIWGLYFRNLGNGSGTLDGYAFTSIENSSSFDFKFGQPFMFEFWREDNYLKIKRNNSGTIVSSSIDGETAVAPGNPIQMNKAGDNSCQWHLSELVISSWNPKTDYITNGVGNFIASRYGFSASNAYVLLSGERW